MQSKKFQGELMTCVVCGVQERSHPQVESQWRGLKVDNHFFYACPKEFPPDDASKEAFKVDYQIVLACCLNEITKAAGGIATPELEVYRATRQKAREQSKFKGFSK